MIRLKCVQNLVRIHERLKKLRPKNLNQIYLFLFDSDNPGKKQLVHLRHFTLLSRVLKIQTWNLHVNIQVIEETFTFTYFLPLPLQSMLEALPWLQKIRLRSTLIGGNGGHILPKRVKVCQQFFPGLSESNAKKQI